MATLTLTKVWVNLLPDGTALAAWSLPRRDRDAEVDGEIHKFAGGRFQAVHEKGTRYSFDVILTQLTLDQVQTLESWLGRTVLVRTHDGQSILGVFFSVGTAEYKNRTYAASISVRSVTTEVVMVL